MPESGVSFSDLWNAAKDMATIMQGHTSIPMSKPAYAVPRGLEPSDTSLVWTSGYEGHVSLTETWSSIASRIGVASGTALRLGATWRFWGQPVSDASYGYLCEAYIYAAVDEIGLGQGFDIEAGFDSDPIVVVSGAYHVAELKGHIKVKHTYATMTMEEQQFEVVVRGDGSGGITQL